MFSKFKYIMAIFSLFFNKKISNALPSKIPKDIHKGRRIVTVTSCNNSIRKVNIEIITKAITSIEINKKNLDLFIVFRG